MILDGSILNSIRSTALFGWLLVIGVSGQLHAQEADTVVLSGIEVTASTITKYGAGARTNTIDSISQAYGRGMSLADVISANTPVFMKSQGNGMLSTISFRGTGASHTAVRWNGVNIGYPMLGQSDFSVLPFYLNPEVKMQHGSGSSLYGSGAIGGVLDIGNSFVDEPARLSLTQEAGSFGTYFSGLSAGLRHKAVSISLKGMLTGSRNDFTFINTGTINKLKERQQNARYNGRGGSLDVQWKNNLFVTRLSTQYTYFDRNIQSTINNNGNPADRQVDESWRTALSFSGNMGPVFLEGTYVQLTDNISFNDSNSKALQNVGNLHLEIAPTGNLSFEAGGQLKEARVYSVNFAEGMGQELRGSIFASALLSGTYGKLSINARQEFVEGYSIPFTPSVGVELPFWKSPDMTLALKSQYAKGYRVPTLNDRFWQPGGVPDLKPELSNSIEAGIAGQNNGLLQASYEFTFYKMWVDDWILWIPRESFWSPENIRSVVSQGVEVSTTLSHTIGITKVRWSANYSFSQSINQRGLDSLDRSVGKQLPYTPLHNGNLSGQFSIRQLQFTLLSDFTGKRFVTTDNERSLPMFTLLNVRASYLFKLKNSRLRVYTLFNNVLNESYQTILNRAMPGFNYRIGITFDL